MAAKVTGSDGAILNHYIGEIKKLFPEAKPCFSYKVTAGRSGDVSPNYVTTQELEPDKQPGRFIHGYYALWFREQRPEDKSLGGVHLNANRPCMAWFHINQMWGLCGMAVVHNANVSDTYTKKGLGKLLAQMKIDMATNMGYGSLVMSNVDFPSRAPHRKIAMGAGFRDLYTFKNPRTQNKINLMVIDLIDNPYGNTQGKEITL